MKKVTKTGFIVLLVLIVLGSGFYWAFYDIQRIDGQEELQKVSSENNDYTVTAYLNNGGATTGYAVLCSVTDNSTGKEKNIYWNDRCTKADIEWLDETTVKINGVELDVLKDTYDYRHD